MRIRLHLVGVTLTTLVLGSAVSACFADSSANIPQTFSGISSKQMADGKRWTSDNLNVRIGHSYCYDDAEPNCAKYGRLYTWQSAQEGCHSLGNEWRLPSAAEWQQLAKQYGGISDDSEDGGKGAYAALSIGGRSGFDARLGGGRNPDGQYARLEAHGFYWTASESSPATAWFYNFGKGGLALHRQREGEKPMALSVRCVAG